MKRFDSSKWITENKYGRIEEQEGGGLIDISAGPEAVLQAAANIPQSTLYSGRTDGAPDDEKIQIKPGSVIAKNMIPTQSEIGSGQSLDDQIQDKFGNLDRALKGGMLSSKAGESPILTFGGKYILDGHHRWSQFLASNPEASVDIADISAPGIDNADEALSVAHLILFALYGKSPTKPFEGENIIGKDAAWVEEYVMGKIVDSAVTKLHAAGKIAEPKKELAAKMYADNLFGTNGQNLGKGTHKRTAMPQGADAGDPTGLTKSPQAAKAGVVNFNAPKASDFKKDHDYMVAAQESLKISKSALQKIIREEINKL